MTITVGWWAVPALITMGTFVYALWPVRPTGYGADIVGAVSLMAAVIVSLVAWLSWSLLA